MMWTTMVSSVLAVFCLAGSGAGAADVLFVTREDDPLDAVDAHIVTFLEGLGHTVRLIDDDEDEADTQTAARGADVVFMSQSVNETFMRNKITAIETPMIVAEAAVWVEMGMTFGAGGLLTVGSTHIDIVQPGHVLAAGLSGTVPVLNATGSAHLGMGIAGDQAEVVARATLSDGRTYDVIYVYEKGALLPVAPADGSGQVAAEMRICFGFDQMSVVEWNDQAYALLLAAVDYALGDTGRALNPDPSDGQEGVSRDVVMSWTPGHDAQSHDLYLGTMFEDVNRADAASPLRVGPGIDANTLDPGRLEYGQTYYWRVDEIGGPPESKVFKGDLWSFTVEPFACTVTPDSITATASSSLNANSGPEKTADGSGLNASDEHDTTSTTMWTSGTGQQPPVWIQYEFDQVYKLHEMWVWNSNYALEWKFGLGVKTATIEYSTDGILWTALANVPEFARAPSAAGYAHNTTVGFGGVSARFVRITCTSSWGGRDQYSLSEVRFFAIPVQARDPNPATGAVGVSPDATLSWRSGREAASHEIHLGTDMQAVADSTAPAATVSQAAYAPANLHLDTTYYWKVVEVNRVEGPGAWGSKVWSFSTSPYLVVDDFEGYGNCSPQRVFQTWIDGLGFSADEFFPAGNGGNGSGAIVGYDPKAGPIMEYTIVHGGHRSMPLSYGGASEATRTYEPAQDWSRHGIRSLVLFFQGDATNTPAELYVAINGVKVPYGGDHGDLAVAEWKECRIDLPAAAGLEAVRTLTIGVSSGQGMLRIDDISLAPSAPVVSP